MPQHPSSPDNLLYSLPSLLDPLDFSQLYPDPQPLEIELGCGDASFLIDIARQHPNHNFLGVERFLGRIRKLDRKGRRLALSNLRGVRIEAAYFLEFLLPPSSIHALHVYFPDPWPKARHEARRLINTRFPRLAHRALIPGGHVYLRTDDPHYFEQMRTVFAAHPEFAAVDTPAELANQQTDFEQLFNAAGKPTLRAAYRAR
jgi:tRNA (guanine-N7-)-methyltransferase